MKFHVQRLSAACSIGAILFSATALTACWVDPYESCMKEEKRKNAYLGEEDYLKQSQAICRKKARAD